MRHALAYVAGFGAVFTLLGITATFAAGPLVDYLPALRMIGGVILIVLGLNLAGILHIPRPRADVAAARGRRRDLAGDRRPARSRFAECRPATPSIGDRLGGRLVSPRGGWLASFGLGAIFAIGWTPCIGIILGGILTMAAYVDDRRPGRRPARRLHARASACRSSLIAAVYDRAPRVMAPLVRHGRVVSLIGGLLVALIGVAMLFDWLASCRATSTFNTAI